MQANKAKEGTYRFILPLALSLERLRIDLPERNTLAPLNVSAGYMGRNGRWHWSLLDQQVVFRLSAAEGKVVQNELRLPSGVFRR
ncbi:MAG: DUF3999 domain-containing protein [Candidatus Thiodiazotropha sp. (ex Lucinoma aequizonata)]|nr:DUF3999 domain-containing protein [Candidatus Thiodiazotropha sp. (ex Lucinoma aequizonata)]MCU7887057.1 DUF3999 domain-containing protein [Candidatus Thiodiazotropha sp. (ex Lucinoma aequizonata)]MCU7894082.1 DUF3999 domain-containing protein [Candidatus Thiodiazotropha sp. (ex Lucinoma aequizonata)]MCU7898759.1 DUF3999 domain-containing protein [Candidatus Thiodiazotropha sp. (ex Lucinoma aequizonata)]MCU7900810.1 DUF3999 domain-containing protein [Candidatus Thiodiazotropha sp. (ex Lucino